MMTMKNKLFYILAASLALVAILLGLTGSFVLADEEAGGAAAQDRLVGMLVTSEYLDLFDAESYFNDHAAELMNGGIIEGDTSAYQGRLYATLVEESYTDEAGNAHTQKKYTFDGVDGIEYFYARMEDGQGSYSAAYGDEAVADGHNYFNFSDDGDDVKLEGVIYVDPSSAGMIHFFNPIYQAADGSIYAVAGSSISSDVNGSEGEAYSQTISSTYTETVNGKVVTDSTSVKITIGIMFTPTRIRVVQFDAQGGILAGDEYLPGALPESIAPQRSAAYIVVETYKTAPDGTVIVSRTLYEQDDESMETFHARADGICVKQFTALVWGE
jgi:hypothetical protein